MSNIPDRLVKLSISRNVTVSPSPWWQPAGVLGKMRRRKKRGFKVKECTLIRSNF